MMQRPQDWPDDGPLDLEVHDLPHASSQTEWWYVNSHATVAGGRKLSIFAAFFRAVKAIDEHTKEPIYGHSLTWAISDWDRHAYHTESKVDHEADVFGTQKIDRGEGSSDPRLNRAFREVFAKGKVPLPDRKFKGEVFVSLRSLDLDFEGATFRKAGPGRYLLSLRSEGRKYGAELEFRLEKPPVRHGRDGVVKSPDGADMYYYFVPRCGVSGSFILDGVELPVESAVGWYDHEFGRHLEHATPAEAPQEPATDGAAEAPPKKRRIAWNWSAVQLDCGTDVSAYTLVDRNSGEVVDQRAIVVSPDGTRAEFDDVTFEPSGEWISTRSFNAFPTHWRIQSHAAGLDLALESVFPDQEFVALISKTTFWEGCCTLTGELRGKPATGRAYIERSGFLTVDTLDDFFASVGR